MMPVVNVTIDAVARQDYLELYKTQGIAKINQRTKELWAHIATNAPWEDMTYTHRAIQAYAWLNDQDPEAHMDRYPLVSAGIPRYGSTHAEVAQSYVDYQIDISTTYHGLFELRKDAIEDILLTDALGHVDTYVTAYVAATEWALVPAEARRMAQPQI